MPAKIDASPEAVARMLVTTPPKKEEDGRYLKPKPVPPARSESPHRQVEPAGWHRGLYSTALAQEARPIAGSVYPSLLPVPSARHRAHHAHRKTI